jgi:hypothetical protein
MPIMNGYDACDRIYELLCDSENNLSDWKLRRAIHHQQDEQLRDLNYENTNKVRFQTRDQPSFTTEGSCPALIFALTQNFNPS